MENKYLVKVVLFVAIIFLPLFVLYRQNFQLKIITRDKIITDLEKKLNSEKLEYSLLKVEAYVCKNDLVSSDGYVIRHKFDPSVLGISSDLLENEEILKHKYIYRYKDFFQYEATGLRVKGENYSVTVRVYDGEPIVGRSFPVKLPQEIDSVSYFTYSEADRKRPDYDSFPKYTNKNGITFFRKSNEFPNFIYEARLKKEESGELFLVSISWQASQKSNNNNNERIIKNGMLEVINSISLSEGVTQGYF